MRSETKNPWGVWPRGFAWIAMACLLLCPVFAKPRKSPFQGKIIAYRPADLGLQLPSFIENKEIYLVQLQGRGKNQVGPIIKLYYQHIGKTNISLDMLDDAPLLDFNLTRQRSCDGTYSQFVEQTREQGDKASRGTDDLARDIYQVIFTENFKNISIPPDYKLVCYTANWGDIKRPIPSHHQSDAQ
jgi:hypothetical protein